jgi:hypothetical protein
MPNQSTVLRARGSTVGRGLAENRHEVSKFDRLGRVSRRGPRSMPVDERFDDVIHHMQDVDEDARRAVQPTHAGSGRPASWEFCGN